MECCAKVNAEIKTEDESRSVFFIFEWGKDIYSEDDLTELQN
jgi:hypothetical protein